MEHQLQTIPVRIYDRDEHIILAAPMPGLEPENISIEIAGTKVTIKGEEYGPRQHSADVIVDEWTIGPYYREVLLHQSIRAPLTNATYGNGVLVLSMPKGRESDEHLKVNFTLHPIAPTRGERIGHQGNEIMDVQTQSQSQQR
jgi:HSP20 family protein